MLEILLVDPFETDAVSIPRGGPAELIGEPLSGFRFPLELRHMVLADAWNLLEDLWAECLDVPGQILPARFYRSDFIGQILPVSL